MKSVMRVILVLGVSLFLLWILIGCVIGKSKYVGTYISEQNQSVLELKSDGTYRFETKGSFLFSGNVVTGEWSAEKDNGSEAILFTPIFSLMGPPAVLVKTKKGNNLIDPVFGETFMKQD